MTLPSTATPVDRVPAAEPLRCRRRVRTKLTTDGTRNVLPRTARIPGDVRSFRPEVSATIEAELRRIAASIAHGFDSGAEVTFSRGCIPLVNDARLAETVISGVRPSLAGPVTGADDHIQGLRTLPRPRARGVLLLDNGEGCAPLHNPIYDFDDAALVHGARLHTAMVRHRLQPS